MDPKPPELFAAAASKAACLLAAVPLRVPAELWKKQSRAGPLAIGYCRIEAVEAWTHWDLNPEPSACGADVMPLHHVPLSCNFPMRTNKIWIWVRRQLQQWPTTHDFKSVSSSSKIWVSCVGSFLCNAALRRSFSSFLAPVCFVLLCLALSFSQSPYLASCCPLLLSFAGFPFPFASSCSFLLCVCVCVCLCAKRDTLRGARAKRRTSSVLSSPLSQQFVAR